MRGVGLRAWAGQRGAACSAVKAGEGGGEKAQPWSRAASCHNYGLTTTLLLPAPPPDPHAEDLSTHTSKKVLWNAVLDKQCGPRVNDQNSSQAWGGKQGQKRLHASWSVTVLSPGAGRGRPWKTARGCHQLRALGWAGTGPYVVLGSFLWKSWSRERFYLHMQGNLRTVHCLGWIFGTSCF